MCNDESPKSVQDRVSTEVGGAILRFRCRLMCMRVVEEVGGGMSGSSGCMQGTYGEGSRDRGAEKDGCAMDSQQLEATMEHKVSYVMTSVTQQSMLKIAHALHSARGELDALALLSNFGSRVCRSVTRQGVVGFAEHAQPNIASFCFHPSS